MLKLDHVSARYNMLSSYVNAVEDVSVTIQDGEIFGIAGESGCGKSTLLKIMYDLVEYPLEICAGTVELCAKRVDGSVDHYGPNEIRTRRWKDISYVPQGAMHVLNPVAKIDVQFYDAVSQKRCHGARAQLRNEIVAYLRSLDLPETVMDSYPHQLSGGMRQRVMIALATFSRVGLILADEPTTALDVVVQRGILTMLSKVQRSTGNSIVIVSHDMGVHYQIAHRLGIMYAGKLIEVGPTDEIFEHPAHPYTQMLIRALPRVGDIAQKEGIPGSPPSLREPITGCRFAPRCPRATARCRVEDPAVCNVSSRHTAACHLLCNVTEGSEQVHA